MKAYGDWMYSSTIHLHALAALPPREKIPGYTLYRKQGGTQSRSGLCRIDTNPLPLPRTETRPSRL
jgi:hypothetical protein